MPPPATAAVPPDTLHSADGERARTGARAFASTQETTRSELLAAPVRWPRPSRLKERLNLPAGKLADGLRTLGIESVGALLEHLPRDRREARAVAQLRPGEQATVAVEVSSIAARPVRRRGMRPLVEATVFDETGTMGVAFFNQPWLVERYRPGTRLLLHGRAQPRGRFAVINHALGDELAGAETTAGETIAHYPATVGVSSTQIAALVREHRGALANVEEPLPARLRVGERLPDRAAALAAMHFPRGAGEAETGRARLAFEELLVMQLTLLRRRALRGSGSAAPLAGERHLTARWLEEWLPFTPTADQTAAMAAIDADLARACPMQRLLMGEVGSGKTVVALYALLRAVEHGMQGALMAPTETLAEQHFATLQALVPDALLPAALLTSSTPARRRADLKGKLASGELKLVVGTHALIEDDVTFDRLAVAVIDEQHRFGVRQRVALDRKGPPASPTAQGARSLAPHVLHMTATPIPRTLALTDYGDLDVTRLRELPRGRRPIVTRVASSERERGRAYERIREELRAGRQAYVVCPLVEESQELQARAASAEFERLREGELRDFRLELLHGQLRPKEKRQAMARFAAGEVDALVATTVIEVGIDVPNATVMLVEDAERYGISQLHQLRGRIGRGEHPSQCLLLGPPGARRLRALAEHDDGFRLAEIDLQLRGEGELAGTRQHGQAEPRVASLPEDALLLERARVHAQEIIAADLELQAPEHALLGEALRGAFGAEALQPIPA
jgi:ATP-dependent DNA helicase RecG